MEPKLVPNVFPKVPSPLKIAIIGEAPGADEESAGIPFVGQSGKFLDRLLAKQGILRDSCFIGNVCQQRPPENKIEKFKDDGPEITHGRAKLAEDLGKFQPNVCLLLGKTALWAAKGVKNISDWRGSLFLSDSLNCETQIKCLASFHPAFALRDYSVTPILTLDISRAIQESREPTLELPQHFLFINEDAGSVIRSLQAAKELKAPIAIDIEGGVQEMSCISVAHSNSHAFIVPFSRLDGSSYWESEEEEYQIWTALAELLGDPKVPKILQNSLYDRFVLQRAHNIVVRNVADDTMLKHWELYCELEKSLGFQASIHTRQPYYKSDRKTNDQDTFYRYCCMDSCVTFEINEVLNKYLNQGQVNHYKANMELLNPLLYMELRGIRYDHEKAKKRYTEVMEKVYGVQHELDLLAEKDGVLKAIDFSVPREEILKQMEAICGLKKDPTKPKKSFADEGYYETKAKLMGSEGSLPTDLKGEISMLCKATLNTKSHKKFQSYLYETCKLPKQWKKDPKTRELKLTTDYEALLKLSKSQDHPALRLALELSRCRTRAQMLSIQPINGRMHCNYNLVGSETGRVTSSKSNLYVFDENTGKAKKVGANLQTMPNDWEMEDESHPLAQGMRDLFLADESCYMAKCDLEGADGWTIGAYMASLGDPTMLEDLKAKLKPAKVSAYGLRHGKESIRGKSREELKKLTEEIKKDDWEYFVSKGLIYGFFYSMGPRKAAESVFIQSEGKVKMTEKEIKNFQEIIRVRYNFYKYQDHFARFANSQQYPCKLAAPNGFVRTFFSRNFGERPECLGEVLAHMPQVVTTWTTNSALHKLWVDPENRTGNQLTVEPMHQVHDEIVVQWWNNAHITEWAKAKIHEWFQTPITLRGINLIVPYDGAYGTNWSMDEFAKVGTL